MKKPMTHAELLNWLKKRYTARQLATVTGITTQAAYQLLLGASRPRKTTLDKLGLEMIDFYREVR